MPAAGRAENFQFPKAATKTLPNGLRVFVVTDPRASGGGGAAGDSDGGQRERSGGDARRGRR